MNQPKQHTFESLNAMLNTPKSFNNWDGFTINKAPITLAKSKQLHTWKIRSNLVCANKVLSSPRSTDTDVLGKQMETTHRVGTYLADATCLSINSRKPTKHINRPCTEMGGTLPFGVRLVFFTTRSISTAMHLTLTLGLYA